jgi:hypothetical protein
MTVAAMEPVTLETVLVTKTGTEKTAPPTNLSFNPAFKYLPMGLLSAQN